MSGVKFLGVKETLREDHARFTRRQEQAISGQLREAAEMTMTESRLEVPVDRGYLRASGVVEGPYMEGAIIFVDMGYGGPSVDYAEIVHEDLDATHVVGKAKYLEDPVNRMAARIPGLLVKVAKRAA